MLVMTGEQSVAKTLSQRDLEQSFPTAFFNSSVFYIKNQKLLVLNQGQLNRAIPISGKRANSGSSEKQCVVPCGG